MKVVQNTADQKVQDTVDQRRIEFVERTTEQLKSLMILGIDEQDKQHVDAYEFALNMCLSEVFRSAAYWENQLQLTLTQIQKEQNEKVS